jgi:hypothetical protein
MSKTGNGPTLADDAGKADGITEVRRLEVSLNNMVFRPAV